MDNKGLYPSSLTGNKSGNRSASVSGNGKNVTVTVTRKKKGNRKPSHTAPQRVPEFFATTEDIVKTPESPSESKKKTGGLKQMLSRRSRSKGNTIDRKSHPCWDTQHMFTNQSTAPPLSPTPSEVPVTPRKLLFRVRLQDDNFKTLTISEETTAADLCTKLSNKLRNERPEQDWDGCELFITVNQEDKPVEKDMLLSENLEKAFVFKRQGEELINPEEELMLVIQRRKEMKDICMKEECIRWYGRSIESFPKEDHSPVRAMLEVLVAFKENPRAPEEQYSTSFGKIQYHMEQLEEYLGPSRKKLQKTRKRPVPRLNIDSMLVEVIYKIADAGGSYASIYSVLVDGMECAMKELTLNSDVDSSAFETEIAVLEALPPHPCLVKYLFHTKTPTKIRLFMTLYDESLQDFIKRRRESSSGPFPLFTIKQILKEIVEGLAYLHSFLIIHRDLKSGNIFIRTNDEKEYVHGVVADFDTAVQVTENVKLHQTIGTPGFMGPEMLDAKNIGYNISSDIFSFGMIVFELLYLNTPYLLECATSFEISDRIISGTRPEPPITLEKEYQPFIHLYKVCTIRQPDYRPIAQDLLNAINILPDTKEESFALQAKQSAVLESKEKATLNPLYVSKV